MSESNDSREAAARELSKGVSEVIGAALGVGASLARVVAEATAGNKPVRSPAASAGPLNAMVHYGLAALTNVVGAVAGSVGSFRPGSQPAPAAASAASGRPRVHRGASLRIPLSIENPAEEPIRNASVECVVMEYHDQAPGRPLGTDAVRFEPATLDIMARDFEKLTVHIGVPLDTAPGAYTAQIDLGTGAFRTTIHFQVLSDDA